MLHRSLLILKYNKMSYIRAIPKLISPLTRPLLSATPRQSVSIRRNISLTKINNSNNDNSVEVVYKKHTGEEFPTTTRLGENLLDVMVNNKLVDELQPGFGACEGTLACSTCHLIFSEEDYKKLEEPTDEELDMFDLAYGLTETSRLGCQVKMEKELDGIIVNVPESINDQRIEKSGETH